MVVNGFINVVASTIERRFTLPSRHSGLIMSCYDIASVLCMIPVSYFGTDSHKPRWLGFGVLIVGLSSIVFSLPHFITGLYEYEVSSEDYKCSLSVNGSDVNSKTVCNGVDERETTHLSNYRFLMMLAQFLHGSGASPLYTLGITYLDDNLPTKLTSVYIGRSRLMLKLTYYTCNRVILHVFVCFYMYFVFTILNPIVYATENLLK